MTILPGFGPLKTFKFDAFPSLLGLDLDTVFFYIVPYFFNAFITDFTSTFQSWTPKAVADPREARFG